MTENIHILDTLLVEIGQFGKYQCFLLALYYLAIVINSPGSFSFVFSTKDLTYRCLIPECDTTSTDFTPLWLENAVPFSNGKPRKCERFKFINGSNTCSLTNFDQNVTEKCNSFTYKTTEKSIINDFDNLHCGENLWKLTLVGTVNSLGLVIGLPIAGYVSDKYGRRTLLIWSMTLCGIAGIIKSFATSYIYFITMEFLDSAFGAGAYSCAFILGVELVGPKHRVLAGNLIFCAYSLGQMFNGAIAWAFLSWRPYILTIYSLSLLMPLYYWLTPESMRWLLTKNKVPEITRILRRAAKINEKTISENTFTKLSMYYEDKSEPVAYNIREYFSDCNLVLRFASCCFCLVTCIFLYYGLTISSVSLVGNSYLDFILTAFIDIPAHISVWLVVDKIGRRICLFLAYLLTAVSCISFIFVPSGLYWLQLTTYLLGKFGATVAVGICYIVSSEMYPTHLRNSLLSSTITVSRIGSLIAPQMPLLEAVWKPFPLTLYAGMSILAAVLSLSFPETTNINLPDTIKEAGDVGKQSPSSNQKLV